MPSEKAQPHGHVTPLPSGLKARCGGPALCPDCAEERRALSAVVKTHPLARADCRFCPYARVTVGWEGQGGHYVFCHSCRARGPICDEIPKAVELWNLMQAAADHVELLRTASLLLNQAMQHYPPLESDLFDDISGTKCAIDEALSAAPASATTALVCRVCDEPAENVDAKLGDGCARRLAKGYPDDETKHCPGELVAAHAASDAEAPQPMDDDERTDLHVRCGQLANEIVLGEPLPGLLLHHEDALDLARGYLQIVERSLSQPPAARDEVGADTEAMLLLIEDLAGGDPHDNCYCTDTGMGEPGEASILKCHPCRARALLSRLRAQREPQ